MVYTCTRCGKQFEAKHKTAVCADCHTAVCVICGREFELKHPYTQKTCSAACRGEYVRRSGIGKQRTAKAQSTLKAKYGVENAQKLQTFTKVCKLCGKTFETTSSRREYCEDTHFGNCPVCGKRVEIKELHLGPRACSEKCKQVEIAKTNLLKYGTEVSVNSKYCRDKSKTTCLEKYGVDHYSKTEEFKTKFQTTMLDRYGTTVPLRNDVIRSKLQATCLEKYGVPYNCMTDQCRSSYQTISRLNLKFLSYLESKGLSAELEFSIDRYSYDFKCGDILVELDPSITHNTYLSIFPDTDPVKFDYHKNKSETAKEAGYRCIHVFDWDDWDKIVDLLKEKTTIYARSCDIRSISKQEANKFTSMYHINGKCNGQNLNYGLYYGDELVEVMTFGKPRYNKKYDYELLRLCSKSDVRVVGGASKLFKQFIREHPECSVISYCDLSKFTGDVYEKIGMTFLETTPPNKIWSKENKKVTQNLLNQRGYDQLFKTNYGKGTSNEQLMLQNGWLPVYDCGQAVYEYRNC